MLLDDIKNKIDGVDVVSFDIFDTLLLRPYADPETLWEHLAYIYNVDNFKNIRKWAFLDAREKYCNDDVEDVTFEQIYEFIPEEYKLLKDKELEFEYKLLQQNFETKQVYDYALEKGKKVIAVSDMYLSKEFLKKVLDKNGFDNIYKIYVSSETKMLKRKGRIFQYVLKDLNLKPSKILHIGDNKLADVEIPEQAGLSVVYYPKIIDKYFKVSKKAKVFYKKYKYLQFDSSIMFGLFALFLHNNKLLNNNFENDKYWYKLGTEYAAPLVLEYTKWLNSKLVEDDINEVLFVARDGYLLQKTFEKINPNIKTHYVYAPRIISLAGTLDFDKKFEFSETESISGIIALKDYFSAKYNDDEKEQDADVSITTVKDAYKFFKKKEPLWKQYSKKEVELYREYIKSLNIVKNTKVAMVDVMTTFFTAQVFLDKVLSDNAVKGYYYWIPQFYRTNYDKKLNYTSASVNGYYIPFVELLITSPEMPIVGLKDNKPIYKENVSESEKIRLSVFSYIAEGTMDFVDFSMQIFKGI